MQTTPQHTHLTPVPPQRELCEPFRSWAGEPRKYPNNNGLAKLFEAVAAAQPDSPALICGSDRLTYAELNRRANRWAWSLREKQIGCETLVGVCLPNSIEALVAMLAVLKAGGAYVPLDPDLPSKRLAAIASETKMPLVLAQSSGARQTFAGAEISNLAEFELRSNSSRAENPRGRSDGHNLAYVMYTSGSVGEPKGVMVEQRSVVRLVRNTNYCEFGQQQVFLHAAPLSFDASTFEIWGALLNGGTLVLPGSSHPSLDEIGRVLCEQRVTTAWLTSGLFNLMVDHQLCDLRGLQQLLTGGDVVSARHVCRALAALPHCRVVNGYGPTENTTFTCSFVMRRGDSIPDSVPIGRPISNTYVYVLDRNGDAAAVGEAGDLFTAGDGVARGYIADPELTAARFLCDPFVATPGRMYRTGDLVRWRPDGMLEFLGRADDQVKVRGHRVEPLEVVRAMQSHPLINQAHVSPEADSPDTKRLVAYYIAESTLEPEELRSFLAQELPEYLIPSRFVAVERFPLNANGKIDREQLYQPHRVSPEKAPARLDDVPTDIERTLREIWSAVLETPDIELDQNFFDLGGDSLLLMSVHSRLQNGLSLKLPFLELFEFTTIHKLAQRISDLQSGAQTQPAKASGASNDAGSERRRAALRPLDRRLQRQP